MAGKAKTTSTVEIKEIERKTITLTLKGDTAFICHAWSEKARKQMLGVQTAEVGTVKRAKVKEPRKPVEEFIDAFYWLTDKPENKTEEGFEEAIANGARFGFPVTAFKQAMASAAYRKGWIDNKMAVRGAVFFGSNPDGLVEVKYPNDNPPRMREDMVKIGSMGSTSDLRYRPEFPEWTVDLEITYDAEMFSAEQLVNFLNLSGFYCGVGEWRPEKDGQFGMFHVVTDKG